MHCYLELVSKQYTAEARDLLSQYRHEHEPVSQLTIKLVNYPRSTATKTRRWDNKNVSYEEEDTCVSHNYDYEEFDHVTNEFDDVPSLSGEEEEEGEEGEEEEEKGEEEVFYLFVFNATLV